MLIKFVETQLLKMGYEESGPMNGRPLLLIHGWPDSVRTWDKLLPFFHEAGFHTYAISLRGFGPTRFLSNKTLRTGSFSALAQDVLDFTDRLGLRQFAIIGHDWGARTAYTISCLKGMERVSRSVVLSVGWGDAGRLSLKQIQNYWYHWYMATERGEKLIREQGHEFTRYIWNIWNPGLTIGDEEFNETAVAFMNPDWASVTLHSYRVRWGFAQPDPAYAGIEDKIKASPKINVPTLLIHGANDPCNDPSTSEGTENLFTNRFKRVLLPKVGHFPQRQKPETVARLAIDWLNS